jgi:hypothetical protein
MVRRNTDGSISVGMLADENKSVEPVPNKTGSVETDKSDKAEKSKKKKTQK